jgi:8-oxo-dGTP pyrophosphatase MutT (NUDIX family)
MDEDAVFAISALLAALDAYPASDDHEATSIHMTKQFLGGTHPFTRTRFARILADARACFGRGGAGHLTGSAWVVDEERAHALLVHHRKLDRWLQPGGHADGQTDLHAVAWREASEETGLQRLRPAHGGIYDVDVHAIPARGDEPEHLHFDIRYAFIADRSEPLVVSDESHALAWFALADLDRDGIDESVRRLARKTARLP